MSAQAERTAADARVLAELAPLPAEPYPGLRPFEPSEWAIFFGRETMIDEVITRLLDRHLVVVHGSSGCGKSSLIRAGVLPWLQMEHARGELDWQTGVMRPMTRPLRNLARALASSLGHPAGAANDQAEIAWHDRLATGTWRPAIERRLAEAPGQGAGRRLCLLIDQFEEVFRYAGEGGLEEAELFVDLLCELAAAPISRLFVMLTMRSDYIGRCAEFDGFAEAVDRCQYLLPRMDNLALLRAIHEPARLFGGDIQAGIGDRLLADARGQDDALPILQHTLMRATAHAREESKRGRGAGVADHDTAWEVTSDDVAAVEGRSGSALSTHAEEVLAALIAGNRDVLPAAEWLFRSLAEIDAAGGIVRRPTRVADLAAIAGGAAAKPALLKVIEGFRAPGCGFLMPPASEELDDSTVVDVSHEALLRRWSRLSDPRRDLLTREPVGWLWRESEDRRRWQFLTMQAQDFANDRRATLVPATTAAYERWWRSHSKAWALRHAREPKNAEREYSDVEKLWQASRRLARREQIWRYFKLSLGGIVALAILVAIVLGIIDIDTHGGTVLVLTSVVGCLVLALGLIYSAGFVITFVRGLPDLWSRVSRRVAGWHQSVEGD